MSNTPSSSNEEQSKEKTAPASSPSPPSSPQAPSTPKKPNVFKRLWDKAGLRPIVLKMTFKGALAPTIALAAFESYTWSHEFTTLGYLLSIMAFLALPMPPRGKFMQHMAASVLFTCVGAAIALLQMQCAVAARHRGGGQVGPSAVGSSGQLQSSTYSPAASATSAVFLFATVWISNVIRAYRPHLTLPTIHYAIFTVIASTYAPHFPNMHAAKVFVKKLLITFLTAFAISSGTSLLIFPITSRSIVQAQMAGLAALFKKSLMVHGEYMHSMTESKGDTADAAIKGSAEAKKMKAVAAQIGAVFSKTRLDMGFAKKEFAFGKWSVEDFNDVFTHFRQILLPTLGLSTFVDIMQSAREKLEHDVTSSGSMETLDAVRRLETEEWEEVLSLSRAPYLKLKKSLIEGLDHICLVLEITKKPKAKKSDVEEKGGDVPRPGQPEFAKYLDEQIQAFHQHRETVMQRWCEKKGIEMPTTFWAAGDELDPMHRMSTISVRKKENQYQLYLLLYLEFLVYSLGKAIVKMVSYADSKVADGTMTKTRFISPGWFRLRKLFSSAFGKSDTTGILSDQTVEGPQVWIGDSLKQKRDPEHLPATTWYQRSTDMIRKVPHFLGSPQSGFAFRASVATLALGIIAYLRQTQMFFLEQRGLWAMIMVAISMNPTTGQGLFGLGSRIFGTVVTTAISIAIWYIGYKQPGAIIPLMFIVMLVGTWFILRFTTYAIVGIISVVTLILVDGYELQADKLGPQLRTSNGQPYYGVYLVAPYRLISVLAGLAVAFIFSVFPYPITSHTTLRKEVGNTLYMIANYYSCVHTTVDVRLHAGIRARPGDKSSPVARLDKARLKVLQKCMLMLDHLKEHSHWAGYEPTFGGKFPKAKYDDLISSISNVFRYLTLISYSTNTFIEAEEEEESEWLRDFRQFTADVNITSHEITSTLCLVSASILNGQPLPPYLKVPKPYAMAELMEHVDPETISVKHVNEPCYAAFAVLEVASALLTEEVASLVRKAKDLVGEVDFSFHITPPSTEQSSTSGSGIWNSDQDLTKGKNE